MSKMHFEELWEKCEQLHKNTDPKEPQPHQDDIAALVDQLVMRLDLYKAIDAKTEIPEEDRQKAKSRTLGEILLTLTHLSLKDNINVYESLGVALRYRSVNVYQKKY